MIMHGDSNAVKYGIFCVLKVLIIASFLQF